MKQNEIPILQNKTVNKFNEEKLYIQLMRIFYEHIHFGKWQPSQQISTEEELCKIYHGSKTTVKEAVNNLVSEGYLIKIQDKGTFVVSNPSVIGLPMRTRLTEDMFRKEVKSERRMDSPLLVIHRLFVSSDDMPIAYSKIEG